MFLAFIVSLVIGIFFARLSKGMEIKHHIVAWVMVICALVSALFGMQSGSLVGALVVGTLAGTVSFLATGRTPRSKTTPTVRCQ